MHGPTTSVTRFARWALFACALILGLRLATLPLYPLCDRTESRYGEIARVMVATGDWVTPRITPAQPFWAKPPLSTWCQAGGIVVLGRGGLALRLPAWLAVVASVVLVWRMGALLGGRLLGAAAGIVFCTAPLTVAMAGGVMTDPYLTLGLTVALWGTVRVLSRDAPTRIAVASLPVGLALAALSKGPIALVFGVPPLAVALLDPEGRSRLRRLPWGRILLAFSALTLPWFVVAEVRTPGFLSYFLLGEHALRFLVPGWEGDLYGNPHTSPWGVIWLYLAIAILPWVVGVVQALLRRWRGPRTQAVVIDAPSRRALWTAALLPPALFSFASGVLPTYVFPALPAASLLIARSLLNRTAPVPSGMRASVPGTVVIPILVAAVLLAGVIGLPFLRPEAWIACSDQPIEAVAAGRRTVHGEDLTLRYSACFYSAGTARSARGVEDPLWDEVRESPADYVVTTRRRNMERIPPDVRPLLVLEREMGDRQLWRVVRP